VGGRDGGEEVLGQEYRWAGHARCGDSHVCILLDLDLAMRQNSESSVCGTPWTISSFRVVEESFETPTLYYYIGI
jgi:hypothetical protein